MQFITHQSHNNYNLSSSRSPCLSVCLSFSLPSSLHLLLFTSSCCPLTLSTHNPSLLCMLIFSEHPPSPTRLALSLVADVGCWDRSTIFPASLLSGGSDNDGWSEGWRGREREEVRWSAHPQQLPVTALSSPCMLQRV